MLPSGTLSLRPRLTRFGHDSSKVHLARHQAQEKERGFEFEKERREKELLISEQRLANSERKAKDLELAQNQQKIKLLKQKKALLAKLRLAS